VGEKKTRDKNGRTQRLNQIAKWEKPGKGFGRERTQKLETATGQNKGRKEMGVNEAKKWW